MLKMDFSFPLPFLLMILIIIDAQTCAGIIRVAGNIGSTISIPLGIGNSNNSSIMNEMNCSHLVNISKDSCHDWDKEVCLRNGVLEMNLTENDSGRYKLTAGNESKIVSLRVCESPIIVHIHCLSDGRADVSCEVGGQSNESVHWTLNGRSINETDPCQKDGGKSIILEKGVHGKLVCHRRNACSSSSIKLSCNDAGDLLQHPLFLYILAACAGGALLLAIIASLITCCCMRSMHHFVPVPAAEDEKDEGITLSAISSEDPKSPPNGEHCEATRAAPASIPNPDSETCGSSKQEPKMVMNPTAEPEGKSETKTDEKTGSETEFREVMVDTAALELVDDCFPDPIDS